jgi:hypothetical protein
MAANNAGPRARRGRRGGTGEGPAHDRADGAPREDGGTTRGPTERAEEVVDRAGERVGQLATQLGFRLRQALARAREEAEDMWAEAQSLRHNGRSHAPPAGDDTGGAPAAGTRAEHEGHSEE